MKREAGARVIDMLTVDAILRMVRLPLCVTDPHQADNPIIYVNDAFLELTGYEEHEVLGRNCRFLRGKNTTRESVNAVKRLVDGSHRATVDIVNYRKDGSEFVNSLQIGPVVDEDGETVLLFGSQLDVTAQRAEEAEVQEIAKAEIRHRVRNIVAVLNSIIATTAHEQNIATDFVEHVSGRLQALSLAHFATFETGDDGATGAIQVCRNIVENYAPFPDQLVLTGEEISVPKHLLTPLSLALHELATNSVKYGAFSCKEGWVTITLNPVHSSALLQILWTERDGPLVDKSGRDSGSKIISRLLERIGGSIEFDWNRSGVEAAVNLPL